MRKYILPAILFLVAQGAIFAQLAEPVRLEGPTSSGGLRMLCTNDAGTISFAPFDGQSNDAGAGIFFLCAGDSIQVIHNQDFNLGGDPNPSTAPGIGYAYYDCPPAAAFSGPSLSDISIDPCLNDTDPIFDPMGNPIDQMNGIWITTQNNNGDAVFLNDGSVQQAWTNGAPVRFLFAPITVDDFNNNLYEVDSTGTAGNCVNVNTDQAFRVIYLNPIEVSQIVPDIPGEQCFASFNVEGGMPEFDNSESYTFNIFKADDPTVRGMITNTSTPGHDDQVRIFVPESGTYQIEVEDGKSCGASFTMDISSCNSVSFEAPLQNRMQGENFCIDVLVEDFDSVGLMEFSVTWDASVLNFQAVTNLNPFLPGLSNANFNQAAPDSLLISWNDDTFMDVSLPDSSSLFQLCFQVIGNPGDESPIRFFPARNIFETVANISGDLDSYGFIFSNGQVNVSNSSLFVDIQTNELDCAGAADGTATVRVAQGLPSYVLTVTSTSDPTFAPIDSVIFENGGAVTFMNLPGGEYQLDISDATVPANTFLDTFIINAPATLDARIRILNDPTCFGFSDGVVEVEVLVNGIIQPNPENNFQIQWNLPDSTGARMVNLPAGPYSVTVTNSDGCTSDASTNLSQPSPISRLMNGGNTTLDTATCSGVADGGINILVVGGIAPNGLYEFNFDSLPNFTGSNYVQNNIPSDLYRFTITDENGCVKVDSVIVPAAKILSIDGAVTDAVCNGGFDGSIVSSGLTSGEAPDLPYTFSWSTGQVDVDPTGSSITGLSAGTYFLTMQDSDPLGCAVVDSFVVQEPDSIQIGLIDIQNESCNIGNDGSATVAVFGGLPPYNYLWSDGQTDSMAVNLVAGIYTVEVTDANNCTVTGTVEITQPVPPQVTAFPNDTLACPDDANGSLTVTAVPGGAPIDTYEWDNGAFGPTITGLVPGNYIVSITATDGCITVDTAAVVAPQAVRIDSILSQSPVCPGESSGQLTVFAAGGTMPYTYIWEDTPQPDTLLSAVYMGLEAGTYNVTVTDANNCPTASATGSVSDPATLQINFTDTTSVSCFGGDCDGSATALAEYTDGSTGLFTFTWGNGETFTNTNTSTAIQLCQGFNTLLVVDSNQCAALDSINIPAPQQIMILPSIDPVSCNGRSDGVAMVTVNGGSAPYDYLWLGDGSTSPTNPNLPAGDYTVVVTDNRNCSEEAVVTVTEPDVLQLRIDPLRTRDVSCNGEMDGMIGVLVNSEDNINSLGPNPYNWSDGQTPASSDLAENLLAGTYFVTVTDIEGCTDSVSFTLIEPTPVQAVISQPQDPRCFGEATALRVDTAFGGNGQMLLDYTFSVDNNGLMFPLDQAASIFAGPHLVTVEDPLGCSFTDSIFINQPDELTVQFNPDEIVIELGDSSVQLFPIINSSLPITTYLWTPSTYLSSDTVEAPFVDPRESLEYTLTVVDVNGCSALENIFVELDRNRNIFLPNVFSPNGDGRNDEFRIFGCTGVTQVTYAQVYDRWGDLVAELSSPFLPDCGSGSIIWDGEVNGEDAPSGVYVYVAEVQFLDGITLTYRGDVTLIR